LRRCVNPRTTNTARRVSERGMVVMSVVFHIRGVKAALWQIGHVLQVATRAAV
jgi:hypothetical protein